MQCLYKSIKTLMVYTEKKKAHDSMAKQKCQIGTKGTITVCNKNTANWVMLGDNNNLHSSSAPMDVQSFNLCTLEHAIVSKEAKQPVLFIKIWEGRGRFFSSNYAVVQCWIGYI